MLQRAQEALQQEPYHRYHPQLLRETCHHRRRRLLHQNQGSLQTSHVVSLLQYHHQRSLMKVIMILIATLLLTMVSHHHQLRLLGSFLAFRRHAKSSTKMICTVRHQRQWHPECHPLRPPTEQYLLRHQIGQLRRLHRPKTEERLPHP